MFYFGNKCETYVVGITKFWLVQLYSVNTDDAAFSLETEATNEAFLMLVGCERYFPKKDNHTRQNIDKSLLVALCPLRLLLFLNLSTYS